MNGKIQNLKNAYASGNHDKLFRAACALVNYDKKHPFAACTYAGAEELVELGLVRSKQPVWGSTSEPRDPGAPLIRSD